MMLIYTVYIAAVDLEMPYTCDASGFIARKLPIALSKPNK
jgi:hypothetical protein